MPGKMGFTVGPLGWAKVLVPENLATAALAILADVPDLEAEDFGDTLGDDDRADERADE